jgi:hypothetical protein
MLLVDGSDRNRAGRSIGATARPPVGLAAAAGKSSGAGDDAAVREGTVVTPTSAASPDGFAVRWDLLRLICVEYLELPGLRLTLEQAQRFWHVDEVTCTDLLNSLVEIAFLRRMRDGRYTRADHGRRASRRRDTRQRA